MLVLRDNELKYFKCYDRKAKNCLQESLREETEGKLQVRVSPRKNGLEVRVFKESEFAGSIRKSPRGRLAATLLCTTVALCGSGEVWQEGGCKH